MDRIVLSEPDGNLVIGAYRGDLILEAVEIKKADLNCKTLEANMNDLLGATYETKRSDS